MHTNTYAHAHKHKHAYALKMKSTKKQVQTPTSKQSVELTLKCQEEILSDIIYSEIDSDFSYFITEMIEYLLITCGFMLQGDGLYCLIAHSSSNLANIFALMKRLFKNGVLHSTDVLKSLLDDSIALMDDKRRVERVTFLLNHGAKLESDDEDYFTYSPMDVR